MYNENERIILKFEDGRFMYEAEATDPEHGEFEVFYKVKASNPGYRKTVGFVAHLEVYRTFSGDFANGEYLVATFAGVDLASMPAERQRVCVAAILNHLSMVACQCFSDDDELDEFIRDYGVI